MTQECLKYGDYGNVSLKAKVFSKHVSTFLKATALDEHAFMKKAMWEFPRATTGPFGALDYPRFCGVRPISFCGVVEEMAFAGSPIPGDSHRFGKPKHPRW